MVEDQPSTRQTPSDTNVDHFRSQRQCTDGGRTGRQAASCTQGNQRRLPAFDRGQKLGVICKIKAVCILPWHCKRVIAVDDKWDRAQGLVVVSQESESTDLINIRSSFRFAFSWHGPHVHPHPFLRFVW